MIEEEGILYAELDLRRVSGSKWMLDVAGHYGRPDVFELILHTEERTMMRSSQQSAGSSGASAPSQQS
jgi:hypothetical protein